MCCYALVRKFVFRELAGVGLALLWLCEVEDYPVNPVEYLLVALA